MIGSLIAFDHIGDRRAAARMVDGRLEDFLVDPPDDRIRPGTIYRARTTRPMKGQGGMMLETPDGSLYLRGAKGLAPGENLIVQVSNYAEDGKAPPATTNVVIKSRYCLVTPGKQGYNLSKSIRDEGRRVELHELLDTVQQQPRVGLILRTACADGDDGTISDDIQRTMDTALKINGESLSLNPEMLLDGPGAEDLAWRDWPVPDLLDEDAGSFERHGIDAILDDMRAAREDLSGGASIFVEPTRALTAVDVNSGRDTSPAAALKANIAALRALPRHLRIRGLGGQVVVDLAPSSKRDRKQLESIAKAAFRADPIETTFVGWTPLGHMEFIRKRERLPLDDVL